MIKNLFLFIAAALISISAFPQLEYHNVKDTVRSHSKEFNRHSLGEIHLSLSPNVVVNPRFAKFAGGINFQLFLGKRISVDADLLLGKHYVQGGPGVIGIPFWLFYLSESGLSGNDDSDLKTFLIMVAAGVLSLEHFSYHIVLNKDLEISPYLSFLQYRINTHPEKNTPSDRLTFATGIHLNKYIRHFLISPYAEYNIGYRDRISGFNAGIGFGICFQGK